jgi:transcriptional pleiotropic regulator of transition state genes
MARKVDDLGRIVLPVETRRLFGIRPGDALEISVAEGSILLRKLESGCVFCDGREGLREFKGKLVCPECSGELGPQPGAPESASGLPPGPPAWSPDEGFPSDSATS